MPGPAPKRSSQRRRRNATPGLKTAAQDVLVEQPDCPAELGVRAREWYLSLARSGQAQFYTASDWQVALICAHAIDLFMETGRATVLAEVRALQSQLLATEGERRRARLELERDQDGEVADVVDADVWRRRLEARQSS